MTTEEARNILIDINGNPSFKYAAYQKYRTAYQEKVNEKNTAYSEALSNTQKLQLWPITGKTYSDDVNNALSQWNVFGYKNEVENALNTLKAQGYDMSTLKL